MANNKVADQPSTMKGNRTRRDKSPNVYRVVKVAFASMSLPLLRHRCLYRRLLQRRKIIQRHHYWPRYHKFELPRTKHINNFMRKMRRVASLSPSILYLRENKRLPSIILTK